MGESKYDDSSRHQTRAAIWSALIGSVGVVVAAWIGVSVGRGRGEDQAESLRKELAQRDAAITELRKEIAGLQGDRKKPADPGDPILDHRPPQPLPEPDQLLATVEEQGFRFDLFGCSSSNGTVSCDLRVTSRDRDRKILLAAEQTGGIRRTDVCFSRGFDLAGSEFVASNVNVGNKVNPDDGQLTADLVAGVSTPVMLVFQDVRPSGSSWSLLQLCGAGEGPFEVKFRDVKVRTVGLAGG